MEPRQPAVVGRNGGRRDAMRMEDRMVAVVRLYRHGRGIREIARQVTFLEIAGACAAGTAGKDCNCQALDRTWTIGRPHANCDCLLRRVSARTVTRDIERQRAQWATERLRDYEAIVDEAVARLNGLIAVYADAWTRSCGKREISSVERTLGGEGAGRTKSGRRVEEMLGNPAYLDGWRKCEEERNRIMMPQKIALTTPDGTAAGVIVLPGTVGDDEWVRVAQKQQTELARMLGTPG
jgi:hypothetical protein